MAILSIQSHVTYGYVGNKASTYPLQSMGYDVWPLNTVQFSSHTGYKNWQGDIFSREHIKKIIQGLIDLGAINNCKAILSGYMGSQDTCLEVLETVRKFKATNDKIIYLCDPVIGNTHCFVKPEVAEFFKTSLNADIITPNQFEAEMLSGITIKNITSLKHAAEYFHSLNIAIVVITGININNELYIFVSDRLNQHLIKTKEYNFETPPNGTGDLFSAIFIGSYIANKSALEAAKNAAYFIDIVMYNTFIANSRELQILSTRYDYLPKNQITSINIKKLTFIDKTKLF